MRLLLVLALCAATSIRSQPIRHHILVKLKPDTSHADKQALLDGLRGMQKGIAVKKHAGFGLQDTEITDSRSSTVGGILDFASAADYQVYAQHPKHLALIQNLIVPFIADGGRAALQTNPYQIKDSHISPNSIRHHILLKLKSDASQADGEALLVGLRGMQHTIGVSKHAEFGLQSTEKYRKIHNNNTSSASILYPVDEFTNLFGKTALQLTRRATKS